MGGNLIELMMFVVSTVLFVLFTDCCREETVPTLLLQDQLEKGKGLAAMDYVKQCIFREDYVDIIVAGFLKLFLQGAFIVKDMSRGRRVVAQRFLLGCIKYLV